MPTLIRYLYLDIHDDWTVTLYYTRTIDDEKYKLEKEWFKSFDEFKEKHWYRQTILDITLKAIDHIIKTSVVPETAALIPDYERQRDIISQLKQ